MLYVIGNNLFQCQEIIQDSVSLSLCEVKERQVGGRWRLKALLLFALSMCVVIKLTRTTRQPPALTILYRYCTGGSECLSHTPGSQSVCAVRTQSGVGQKLKFPPPAKSPMLLWFVPHCAVLLNKPDWYVVYTSDS